MSPPHNFFNFWGILVHSPALLMNTIGVKFQVKISDFLKLILAGLSQLQPPPTIHVVNTSLNVGSNAAVKCTALEQQVGGARPEVVGRVPVQTRPAAGVQRGNTGIQVTRSELVHQQ